MSSSTPPAIIAVDIDGTFLDPNGAVLPGTRAEFARAREMGATILLASGRPTGGLRRLVSKVQLDLDGLVLAGSNGSVVVDHDSEETIARHSISADLAPRLVEFMAQFEDVLVMVCDLDDLVVDRPDHPQVAIESEGNGLHVRVVPDLRSAASDDLRVDKLLMYGQPDQLRPAAAAFQEEFGDVVESSFSAPFYFEATAPGIDKGSALADVAARLGVEASDSVAFGDNGNDLPLLRRAGLGVAMSNAIGEVREAADRVTASNAEEGIALVLADLFGGGEKAAPVHAPEIETMYPAGFDVVLNDEDEAPEVAPADADPDSTRGTAL